MATSIEFIDYVMEQLSGIGELRYKKMFGEYMVYVNDKPIVIVCDDTAFVKKWDCIADLMKNAEIGFPYEGAKEHYVLDIDNRELCLKVLSEIEKVAVKPKKRK